MPHEGDKGGLGTEGVITNDLVDHRFHFGYVSSPQYVRTKRKKIIGAVTIFAIM